jgi:hypothetical protein
MGFVLEKTGTPAGPTALVAGILLLAAIVVLIMRSVYFAGAGRKQ